MTQMILNVDNPKIVPSLKKVLRHIDGVTIAKTKRSVKEETLRSIERSFKELKAAQEQGLELPDVDALFDELEAV